MFCITASEYNGAHAKTQRVQSTICDYYSVVFYAIHYSVFGNLFFAHERKTKRHRRRAFKEQFSFLHQNEIELSDFVRVFLFIA